jgi:hypothetical protein
MDRAYLIDRAAAAYDAARCQHREGPYGFYNYTSYGAPLPYVVRDFRNPADPNFGQHVVATTDEEQGRRAYEQLTREHIFGCVVDAVLNGLDYVAPPAA